MQEVGDTGSQLHGSGQGRKRSAPRVDPLDQFSEPSGRLLFWREAAVKASLPLTIDMTLHFAGPATPAALAHRPGMRIRLRTGFLLRDLAVLPAASFPYELMVVSRSRGCRPGYRHRIIRPCRESASGTWPIPNGPRLRDCIRRRME